MERTPAQRIPGNAIFHLTYMGSVTEVRLRCKCEPLTDAAKAKGCEMAIRADMKAHRGHNYRAKKYTAEYVCFSPDRIYQPPVEGPHEFQAYVLQEHPVLIAAIKPFVANTAKEAWEEAVRRVLASYKPEHVHADKLYGAATAMGNPDDTFGVEYVPRRTG